MIVVKKDLEAERLRFIQKGGSCPKENKKSTNICLRIPTEMLIEIDQIVLDQRVVTRTTWILQALQEKIVQIKNVQ